MTDLTDQSWLNLKLIVLKWWTSLKILQNGFKIILVTKIHLNQEIKLHHLYNLMWVPKYVFNYQTFNNLYLRKKVDGTYKRVP